MTSQYKICKFQMIYYFCPKEEQLPSPVAPFRPHTWERDEGSICFILRNSFPGLGTPRPL